MRILDYLGTVLRPVRSDSSKLLEAQESVSEHPRNIELTSTKFGHDGSMPKECTIDGQGVFPGLSWKVPFSYTTLLLVVEDPDAPKVDPFVHAIAYNIPAGCFELPQSAFKNGQLDGKYVDMGISMGVNSAGKNEYMPPAPPNGHGRHHYHFQLIALDTRIDLLPTAGLAEFKAAIEGHVLAFGELIGNYERK